MKVTRMGDPVTSGQTSSLGGSGGTIGGGGGVGGGSTPSSGQVPTSNGSNSWTWQPVVSTVSANGSNTLLGPHVNLSSGSNIVFSVSSNTLFIHSTATGSAAGDYVTTISGGGEVVQSHGTLGTTETVDLANGNYHKGTLNANCTFTFTVAADTRHRWFTLELLEDGTGGWTPTFPGTVTRVDGNPTHTTTAGTTTVYYFWTTDGGSSWKGGALGGGGSSSITIQDEGTPLTTAATVVNFVGAGVVASGTGTTKTVTIEGVTAANVSAVGFVGEVLMVDGITNPPEPLLNEATDDWLYQDVG